MGYVIIVTIFWTKSKSLYFMLTGQSIWFMLLAYVCSFLGALQVPAFIAALTYLIIGFAYNWKYIEETDENSDASETKNQSFIEKCAHFWDSPIIKSTPNRQPLITQPSSVQPISSPIAPNCEPTALLKTKLELNFKAAEQARNLENEQSNKSQPQSAIYFKGLFLACLATILYKQLIVLAFSLVPILVYILSKVVFTFGFKEYFLSLSNEIFLSIQVSLNSRFPYFGVRLMFDFSVEGLDCGSSISLVTIMFAGYDEIE